MRVFAVVLLAAGVAACGEIPQPFRHDGAPPPLTRPKLARGLTVRPVETLPDGVAMAEALVKALEVYEVPAVVRAGPAFGHVVETETGEQGGRRGLLWRMNAPDGDSAAIRFQPLPATAWAGLDPTTMRREAETVAAALAAKLTDPDAAPARDATIKRIRVTVTPFKGLPGDGDSALTRAARQALERGGLLVRDGDGDYMVEGKVGVIPGAPGEETVAIAWTVRDKAGAELATIDQEGAVPRGRLMAPWGSLARDVAEGGAAGVLEVIRTARNKR